MMRAETCRACDEPFYQAIYPKTGRRAPIEVAPNSNGNILVDEEAGTYRILTGVDLEEARQRGVLLRLNHFAQCPGAVQFHHT